MRRRAASRRDIVLTSLIVVIGPDVENYPPKVVNSAFKEGVVLGPLRFLQGGQQRGKHPGIEPITFRAIVHDRAPIDGSHSS
jgi:hypothetical protein